MALQLRIISDQRRQLGGRASLLLEARGATIGRSSDNDWVLPDPQRYVSAHHARVHYRDGLYILEDVSTNGVFINTDEQPVSRRGAHVLQNGDVLRMGEYHVMAVLDPDPPEPPPADTPPEDTTPTALPGELQVRVVHSLTPGGSDIDASLNLDDLLGVDATEAARLARERVNAFGHPVDPGLDTGSTGSHLTGTPVRLSALIADADDSLTDRRALAQRIARLGRAAELAQERHAQAQPQSGDLASGLAAFCKGAGIDQSALPGDAQSSLLHTAGLLLRESLVGLKDLERVRRDTTASLGINLPEDPEDPRPSLAHLGVEDVLVQVLSQHQTRRLDAVQWLRGAIDAARAHDRAVFEAMHAAFTQFIARLDPVELESRFQRGLHNPRGAEARYWSLFGEFYRNIAEMPSGQLPHTFTEAFANAYRDLLKK